MAMVVLMWDRSINHQPACNYAKKRSNKGFRYSNITKWFSSHVEYLIDPTEVRLILRESQTTQFRILGQNDLPFIMWPKLVGGDLPL